MKDAARTGVRVAGGATFSVTGTGSSASTSASLVGSLTIWDSGFSSNARVVGSVGVSYQVFG